jgi:hypothetical protein
MKQPIKISEYVRINTLVGFVDVKDIGDETAIFQVIEDRGNRLMVFNVEHKKTMAILPTSVYFKNEMYIIKA